MHFGHRQRRFKLRRRRCRNIHHHRSHPACTGSWSKICTAGHGCCCQDNGHQNSHAASIVWMNYPTTLLHVFRKINSHFKPFRSAYFVGSFISHPDCIPWELSGLSERFATNHSLNHFSIPTMRSGLSSIVAIPTGPSGELHIIFLISRCST